MRKRSKIIGTAISQETKSLITKFNAGIIKGKSVTYSNKCVLISILHGLEERIKGFIPRDHIDHFVKECDLGKDERVSFENGNHIKGLKKICDNYKIYIQFHFYMLRSKKYEQKLNESAEKTKVDADYLNLYLLSTNSFTEAFGKEKYDIIHISFGNYHAEYINWNLVKLLPVYHIDLIETARITANENKKDFIGTYIQLLKN